MPGPPGPPGVPGTKVEIIYNSMFSKYKIPPEWYRYHSKTLIMSWKVLSSHPPDPPHYSAVGHFILLHLQGEVGLPGAPGVDGEKVIVCHFIKIVLIIISQMSTFINLTTDHIRKDTWAVTVCKNNNK